MGRRGRHLERMIQYRIVKEAGVVQEGYSCASLVRPAGKQTVKLCLENVRSASQIAIKSSVCPSALPRDCADRYLIERLSESVLNGHSSKMRQHGYFLSDCSGVIHFFDFVSFYVFRLTSGRYDNTIESPIQMYLRGAILRKTS